MTIWVLITLLVDIATRMLPSPNLLIRFLFHYLTDSEYTSHLVLILHKSTLLLLDIASITHHYIILLESSGE
jgi:hypothetical protein